MSSTTAECSESDVHTGAVRLRLDDYSSRAVITDTRWMSEGASGATDRYEIRVNSGVVQLTLDTAVSETSDHGYPVIEHIKRLLTGEIIWAPAISGAFALTTRGGDFSLHLGQDLAIGYLSHTDTEVRLYLQETLTFLMLTSEAAVGFTPAT